MSVQAINSDTADIPSVNMAQQGADIAAPAAGRWQLYFKAGGLYARSSAGGVIGPFLVTAPDALIIAEIDGVPSGQPTTLQFPNGTISDQGGGVYRYTPAAPAGGDVVLIERQTVGGGGAASFDFTGIAGTYSGLMLDWQARSDTNATSTGTMLTYNGDGGANYSYSYYQENNGGGSPGTLVGQTNTGAGSMAAATSAAGGSGWGRIVIPAYAGTTFYKGHTCQYGFVTSDAGAGFWAGWMVGRWLSTAAITRVTIAPTAGSLVSGSVCSLYGLN